MEQLITVKDVIKRTSYSRTSIWDWEKSGDFPRVLQERHRAAVAGMRSSVSAKNGRFLAITIYGDGPFVPEILGRRGAAGLAVHNGYGAASWTLPAGVAPSAAGPAGSNCTMSTETRTTTGRRTCARCAVRATAPRMGAGRGRIGPSGAPNSRGAWRTASAALYPHYSF